MLEFALDLFASVLQYASVAAAKTNHKAEGELEVVAFFRLRHC